MILQNFDSLDDDSDQARHFHHFVNFTGEVSVPPKYSQVIAIIGQYLFANHAHGSMLTH